MTAGRQPRVLVDATNAPADRGGVGRYVDGLLGALTHRAQRAGVSPDQGPPDGADLVLAVLRTDVERYTRMLPGIEVIAAPAAVAHRPARLAWEQTGLPLLAQQVGAEVLHSPYYTCPLRTPCPVTVTVHDATFFTEPEHYDKTRRTFFRSAIKTALRRATRVIVPSKATRDELIRLLPVLADRQKAVDDLFEEMFSNTVTRSFSVSNAAGWGAGRAAADAARLDIDRTSLEDRPGPG